MSAPSPPSPPDDARDPQVAAWLTVEPLDPVTRARLVRDALAGSVDASLDAPPNRRHRFGAVLAVAAVLAVLLAVTGAVLVSRGDDDPTTASDTPAAKIAPEASRQPGDSSAIATPDEAAPDATDRLSALPDVGDLGDVSTPAQLERSTRAALTVPLGAPTTELSGCAVSAGQSLGTPIAVGSGRIDGQRATVVISDQANGSTAAVAVAGPSCGRAVSVTLP